MTCKEKLKLEHPELLDEIYEDKCPSDYGYLDDPSDCHIEDPRWCPTVTKCAKCWDREIPEESEVTKKMTCKEKLMMEHPKDFESILDKDCPSGYGYLDDPSDCQIRDPDFIETPVITCTECWNREIPEEREVTNKMTCEEKLKMEHPEVNVDLEGECPSMYGYLDDPAYCHISDPNWNPELTICKECWSREIPETTEESHEQTCCIKDSGARREFETGAVRDICEGKGRCDLMPLDIVGKLVGIYGGTDKVCVIRYIHNFQYSGCVESLFSALRDFGGLESVSETWPDIYTMILDVAKQFEDGAKKYGEYNWQKGIPTHCYIDSAVRHYLKFLRGDKDEPHDRAFVWNILCCIWTCANKPELNDYPRKEENKESNDEL